MKLFTHSLCIAMRRVRHPAARFHLVCIQTPEVQFLLEQRSAHVGRVVKFSGPVVVEYLWYTIVVSRLMQSRTQ